MEMLAIRLTFINRGELEEADTYYAKLEPLWACLLEERKVNHDKMMAKLEDKMDADKNKLMTVFEGKIEDNSEKFKITRDTLVSRRDAHQEAGKACLGNMEARIEIGPEQNKILK
jgi:hypothetical protein